MVGLVIRQVLHKMHIRPKPGCSCWELAKAMDAAGPEAIEADINYWLDALDDSVRLWRKLPQADDAGLLDRAAAIAVEVRQPTRLELTALLKYAIAESKRLTALGA